MGTKKPTTKRKIKKKKTPDKPKRRFRPLRWLIRWGAIITCVFLILVFLLSFINPPTTPYMLSEKNRIGQIDHQWVPIENVATVLPRSLVAAEDANFCLHWGLDLTAIEAALNEGGNRGASTISQQVVKNVFLWHGRSYVRKALEALITPIVEAIWSKRRILEIYMNVAEFNEGIFGVKAASRHYFGIGPEELSPTQSARLAAVLPNPKNRSASRPSSFVRKRSASILDGAATLRADGRSDCFED